MTIGCNHHSNFNLLVSQPGYAAGPFTFYGATPFEGEAKFGEKCNGLVE
jgi:hypothetical protein